jgi:hypothetical protein
MKKLVTYSKIVNGVEVEVQGEEEEEMKSFMGMRKKPGDTRVYPRVQPLASVLPIRELEEPKPVIIMRVIDGTEIQPVEEAEPSEIRRLSFMPWKEVVKKYGKTPTSSAVSDVGKLDIVQWLHGASPELDPVYLNSPEDVVNQKAK